MKCVIVGGSNSITGYGWVPQFKKLAAGKFTVDNLSLGGCTSSYGVARILGDDLASKYDRIVFEFTLNDVNYVNNGTYGIRDFRRNLDALVQHPGVLEKLIFVLLMPQGPGSWQGIRGQIVLETYRRIAAGYGVPCCDIAEYLQKIYPNRERFLAEYKDPAHIGPALSQRVADRAFSLVQGRRPAPQLAKRPPQFDYRPDDAPRIIPPYGEGVQHAGEEWVWTNSLLTQRLLRLEPGASVTVPAKGRLTGILARAELQCGFCVVGSGATKMVKNFNDAASARIAPFLSVQMLRVPIAIDPSQGISLTVGVSDDDLYRLHYDISPVEGAYPPEPPDKQLLSIAGFIVDGFA